MGQVRQVGQVGQAPRGEGGVEGHDEHIARLGDNFNFPLDALARIFNFFLSSQEKKNVATGLFNKMNLHRSSDGSLHINITEKNNYQSSQSK